jgi:hypothetical protein
VFGIQRYTQVAQTLVEREPPGAMSMLADAVTRKCDNVVTYRAFGCCSPNTNAEAKINRIGNWKAANQTFPAHKWVPLCDNRLQSTTIPGSPWKGGHHDSESLTGPTMCACERCLDDAPPHEPPTDVWQDIRNRERNKQDTQTVSNL